MSDLRELYQEVILDHNRHPRNFGPLEGANHTARGHNPLCGDIVVVHVKLADGVVADVAFEGNGCAISKASASVMTETLKGKTLEEAQQIKNSQIAEELALPPVKVHCSVLAEDAIKAAVTDYHDKKNEGDS